MIERTMFAALSSPISAPRDINCVLNFCSCCDIRALISGRVARMWCMRILMARSFKKDLIEKGTLENYSRYSACAQGTEYHNILHFQRTPSAFRRIVVHAPVPRQCSCSSQCHADRG